MQNCATLEDLEEVAREGRCGSLNRAIYSNNGGELHAITECLVNTPLNQGVNCYIDSMFVINGMNEALPTGRKLMGIWD